MSKSTDFNMKPKKKKINTFSSTNHAFETNHTLVKNKNNNSIQYAKKMFLHFLQSISLKHAIKSVLERHNGVYPDTAGVVKFFQQIFYLHLQVLFLKLQPGTR